MGNARGGWWGGAKFGFVIGCGVGAAATALAFRRDVAVLANSARSYLRRSASVEHPVLIVNRWSGDGKAEQYDLASAAAAAGVEVVMLERGDDLTQLAKDAAARGADALGMAGGDGSLGLVAAVANEAGLPFFCIPVGTRNHFALDLGLDRDDPLAALAAITDGEEISIDHGVVGGRLFLNNVSLGAYPKAVKKEDYRAKKVTSFLDVLAAGAVSPDERPDVIFSTPDGRSFESTPVLTVSVDPYVQSGPPDFARRRRLDDGVLGVTAVTGVPDADVGKVDLKSRDFESWTASSFTVDAKSGVVEAGVDGEAIDFPAPLHFEIRQRGLRVLVPRGTRPGYIARGEALTAEILDLVQIGGEPEADGS